jgi:ABC-type polysaccharide/polyol phosphate transport system ATPase subunit
MAEPAIELDSVSKRYWLGEDHSQSLRELTTATLQRLRHPSLRRQREELWSLRDIDLEIAEGDAVGVIGRNGAGKSTLLKVLSRITEPTEGVSRTRGRVSALLEVGTGFHPELTGRENVFLNGAILGMTRRDILARFDDIITFAGVEQFVETPVKRYSSGMYLRLAFAVAAHLEPDILVVDEVLAVGDAEFQSKCLRRMETVEREGRTVVFVSHNLEAVSRLCTRGVWLEEGAIRAVGSTDEVIQQYLESQAGVDTGSAATDSTDANVALRQVKVVSPQGADVAVLRRDQPFDIELHFTVRTTVPDLNFSAFLTNGRGVEVLNEAWADTAPHRPTEPGDYVARLAVPAILNVGDYTIGVWMGGTYETFYENMVVRSFRLEGDVRHRPNRTVALGLPWDLHTADRKPG